uniref:Putative secreted protein n=1 Tax=Anopheles darlingi TaxID=43151 RepID=A0A2M4DJB5_ANODA
MFEPPRPHLGLLALKLLLLQVLCTCSRVMGGQVQGGVAIRIHGGVSNVVWPSGAVQVFSLFDTQWALVYSYYVINSKN